MLADTIPVSPLAGTLPPRAAREAVADDLDAADASTADRARAVLRTAWSMDPDFSPAGLRFAAAAAADDDDWARSLDRLEDLARVALRPPDSTIRPPAPGELLALARDPDLVERDGPYRPRFYASSFPPRTSPLRLAWAWARGVFLRLDRARVRRLAVVLERRSPFGGS